MKEGLEGKRLVWLYWLKWQFMIWKINSEVGIDKRKQESKKTRKQELDQETDQENKKKKLYQENKKKRKKTRKRPRKGLLWAW